MSDEFNIGDAMDSLDDGDMARVERLIEKLAKQKQKNSQGRPPKNGGNQRKKRRSNLDNSQSEPSIQGKTRGKRPPRQPNPNTNNGVQRRGQGQQKRKTFTKREAIDTSGQRHNKFEDFGYDDQFKQDSELDQKLSGNNRPTPRMGSNNNPYVEATCVICNWIFDVTPNEVYNDPDKGPIYKCNDCASQEARGGRRG